MPSTTTTIADVASRCGVSTSTVYKILSGSGARFAEATRIRVQRSAAELGYRLNSAAKAVRVGRHGAVVLMQDARIELSAGRMPFFHGLARGLAARDNHLIYAEVPDDELDRDDAAGKVFRESMADGVIVNYHRAVPAALVASIESLGLPWVVTNAKLPSHCIYPDELAAGRDATRHLLRLGHRRIAYLDAGFDPDGPRPSRFHYSRFDRLEGYRRAMAAANLPDRPVLATDCGEGLSGALESVRALLRAPGRPTAFVFDGDPALPASALWAEGLRCPDDVSLVGMDCTANVWPCRLESTLVDWPQIAAQAIARLFADPLDTAAESVPVLWISGGSTAPCATSRTRRAQTTTPRQRSP